MFVGRNQNKGLITHALVAPGRVDRSGSVYLSCVQATCLRRKGKSSQVQKLESRNTIYKVVVLFPCLLRSRVGLIQLFDLNCNLNKIDFNHKVNF